MWLTDVLGESFAELADRLDRRGALETWQRSESALLAAGCVADLRSLTAAGRDPGRSDVILGALVRLAAADGGDDQDATLVVLHLLAPGASALRRRLRAAAVRDAEQLIVGQLAVQIRAFPWRTRRRAHAANLLRDTAKALHAELRPQWSGRELVVDPQQYERLSLVESGIADVDAAADLADLLRWARATGVVDPDDVAVLVEYVYSRELLGGAAHARVGAAHGVSARTCKRRCASALSALRTAAPRYLAA